MTAQECRSEVPVRNVEATEAETMPFWEWCCYTKRIGPAITLIARRSSGHAFRVTSAGTQLDQRDEGPQSRIDVLSA